MEWFETFFIFHSSAKWNMGFGYWPQYPLSSTAGTEKWLKTDIYYLNLSKNSDTLIEIICCTI